MSLTVDDMVSQVRAQLDETNTANVTDSELVDALNRGQRKAANMTARYFRDLMWAVTTVTTSSADTTYNIPDAAYGRRINHVTVQIGSIPYPLKRISNADKHNYDINSQAQRPYYYTATKNTLEIYPPPAGGLTLNVHYTAKPEDMVKQQGRIESINSGGNYVIIDAIGPDISAVSTGFNSYVNLVDYTTGAVKATLQVASINTITKQVTFKSASPSRTSVLGKTIATSIPSTVEADDYLSIVTGTCVPELPEAYIDFLMQSAVVDIRRRFGEPLEEEYRHYKELEEEIKKMWIGRESQNRIRKASTHWKGPFSTEVRRLFS
jgi:hypothetical protein